MSLDPQPYISHRGTETTAMLGRARRYMPGGVNSNVRLGTSVVFESGAGAWLRDVDGNMYVDYALGQGPAFLGHAPDRIADAVATASTRGIVFGGTSRLEVEAVELLCETLQWPDMARLCATGTEAVQAAIRVARAATSRAKWIRFEGHYHGWLDDVLLAPQPGASTGSAGQLAAALDSMIVLPWNDEAALADGLAQHDGEVAAIVMEPAMFNTGAIPPRPGYLEAVRALADAHETVLIFDEIITGFRLAKGGAAELFGVVPDLATYGKAMGAGWPVAALAGRYDLLESVGFGSVVHAGTFNGNAVAAAATLETLKVLRDASPYEGIERIGQTLIQGLRQRMVDRFPDIRIQGYPTAFHVAFGAEDEIVDMRSYLATDTARTNLFARHLARFGVWTTGRGLWYVSSAHGRFDVIETLERVDAALEAWHE